MAFHKEKFYIALFKPEEEPIVDNINFRLVEGWVDDEGNLGYYKPKRDKWFLTDLSSGVKLYSGKTRKECFEFSQANQDKIKQAHGGNVSVVFKGVDETYTFDYDEIVKRLEKWKKEDKKD